jgi:dTMP kinase
VAQIIGPALRDGMVVLCDRFGDATLAYQGYGRCLDLEVIERLNSLASQGITPDLTLLFDCSVELGIGRAFQRISNNESAQKEDRFEQESLDFHRKVREGYLEIARREPERIQVIDASLDASEIHRIVCEVVEARLPYPRA